MEGHTPHTNRQYAGMSGTKLAIFEAAVDLFSSKGYSTVGIRQIAKAVGIKSSSIYNHFESKDAIADQMYRFIHDCYFEKTPFLEDILEQIPGIAPSEALDKLLPPCEGPELFDILKNIVVIAIAERNNDYRARDLVSEIYRRTKDRISAVIDKYQSLDLIEPIEVNLFTTVFINFDLSPTAYTGEDKTLPFEEWRDGRRLLFGLIREK